MIKYSQFPSLIFDRTFHNRRLVPCRKRFWTSAKTFRWHKMMMSLQIPLKVCCRTNRVTFYLKSEVLGIQIQKLTWDSYETLGTQLKGTLRLHGEMWYGKGQYYYQSCLLQFYLYFLCFYFLVLFPLLSLIHFVFYWGHSQSLMK